MESYEETAVMIKQQSELSSNDRVYVTPPERQLLNPSVVEDAGCFDTLNTVFIS